MRYEATAAVDLGSSSRLPLPPALQLPLAPKYCLFTVPLPATSFYVSLLSPSCPCLSRVAGPSRSLPVNVSVSLLMLKFLFIAHTLINTKHAHMEIDVSLVTFR